MKSHIYTLIQQTKYENPDIRRQSAFELGKLTLNGADGREMSDAQEEVIRALIDLLADEHIAVREAAEEALTAINSEEVVKALILCLSSSSTTILNYAIEILSRIGHADIASIRSLLESKDHDIRKFGCDILGNLKYTDAVYELIELLNDPHVNVAIAAGESLGKLGKSEAAPYLIRALHHPDTWMKCIAAEALGKIGDSRAVEPFIEMSAYEDPIVLYTVIKAMGNLHDERVLPYILSVLQANPIFAPSAVQSIQTLAALKGDEIYTRVKIAGIDEEFLRLLHNDNVDVLKSAIHLVGHLQIKEAVHQLGQLLAHRHESIVEETIQALVRIGEPGLDEIHLVFEHLLEFLRTEHSIHQSDPPPATRIPLIHVLGEIGSPQSLRLLIRALDDRIADEIRIEAVAALGKILSGELRTDRQSSQNSWDQDTIYSALQRLIDMTTDPCEALRISAAEALGDSGRKVGYEPLITLLQESSVDVREAASLALTRIEQMSQEEKLQPLHQLLENSGNHLSDGAKASVIRTISRIGGEKESDFLLQFFQAPSPLMQIAAIEALQMFSGTTFQALKLPELLAPLCYDPESQVRLAAIQTLVTWRTRQGGAGTPSAQGFLNDMQILTPLRTLLHDSQPRVQYEACQQLAELIPTSQIPDEFGAALVDDLMILLEKEEMMVRLAAVETLTVLKSYIPSTQKTIPVLQSLLKHTDDPELQNSLRQALVKLS